jgi:hypothetical protein
VLAEEHFGLTGQLLSELHVLPNGANAQVKVVD